MTIAAGSRLGPYEILAPLGAGGMGEVYRARDTRLGREVAIKVLPSHLSSSPESRQRFEREAKTISALSHPHICALYDVGNQDGVEYLVMEYLKGGRDAGAAPGERAAASRPDTVWNGDRRGARPRAPSRDRPQEIDAIECRIDGFALRRQACAGR